MRKFSEEEKTAIDQLIRDVMAVTKCDTAEPTDHDAELALQALTFCLWGIAKTRYGISSYREAIEFCAANFKTYAQTTFS